MRQTEIRRILHFTESLDRGGLEQIVLSLAEYHTGRFAVTVGCYRGGEAGSRIREIPGVEFTVIPPHRSRLRRILRLIRFMRRRRFDLVVVHYCLDASIAAILTGQLLVETIHTTYIWLHGKARLAFRWICARAEGLVAVSDAVRAYTETNFLGKPTSRLVTIANGVDTARFNPGNNGRLFREELGAASDDVVVGTVSTLVPAKNIQLFVRAVPELSAWFPAARFVVVGCGPDEPALRRLAEELKASSLLFLGHRTDVDRIMAGLDVLVLPSLFEGLPLALLEAMASGKAVVAAAVGGIPGVVVDGANGLLLEDHSLAALSRQVARAIAEAGLRRELGLKARETVCARYSVERMVHEAEEYYLGLCSKRLDDRQGKA